MKIPILSFLAVIISISSCSSQEERIESKLMECTFQSYPDEGIEFKNLIANYQALLVKEGVLRDTTGESYRNIFKKLAEGNGFDKQPSTYFFIEHKNINPPDFDKKQLCQEKVISDSSKYDTTKLFLFQHAFAPNNPNSSRASTIAKEVVNILTDEDFELTYYKLHAFLIFSYIDTDFGLNQPETEPIDSTSLKNALRITIDRDNIIYVEDKNVSLEELKNKVRLYEEKNKSKSIFLVRTDNETKYSTYYNVQQSIIGEIQYLRENFSKKNYSKSIHELSEEQLSEVNEIYPQKLVEH
ncbi:MAG: hypothetical protein DSY83_13515 [Flavobacteriia bacterium]|nr:MAG: hypothetical protein DSY83_13515 [Flavobacteriia bacterium]